MRCDPGMKSRRQHRFAANHHDHEKGFGVVRSFLERPMPMSPAQLNVWLDGSRSTSCLMPRQELHGLAPGSAFKVTARTEAALAGNASEVYGDEISDLIHAVPPDLVDAQTHPSDASTTEFVLDYEVRGTSGRLHYVVVEHKVPTASGKTTQQASRVEQMVCAAGTALEARGSTMS